MQTTRQPIAVIAGGTGFLGQSLANCLIEQGWSVVVLGRTTSQGTLLGRLETWDARTVGDWAHCLEKAAVVVNLAGRSVDCIKSPDHCDEILRSRVESTCVLGQAIRQVAATPKVWVQISTTHIYGDPPIEVCDELSPPGYGLAPTVGQAWEAAFLEAKPQRMRGVVLRTSFVLGRGGGALTRLGRLTRLGLGGTIGHGRQGISWIHGLDLNRLFLKAINDPDMHGVYNATAPQPVSNRDFMRTLRKAIGMPIGLPAPAFGVRIAAPHIMRTDPELALYGRYVVSKKLLEEGFEFKHPDVESALREIYR